MILRAAALKEQYT